MLSIVFKGFADLPKSFDNLLRVEVVSSARAAATLRCPETSIWQLRYDLKGHIATEVQGMPRFTVCVEETPEEPRKYLQNALQHRSAVLFLLPFAAFRAAEPYALEVVVDRPARLVMLAGDSPSELSAELVNIALEKGGHRLQCGSRPLGSWPPSEDGDAGNEPSVVPASTPTSSGNNGNGGTSDAATITG